MKFAAILATTVSLASAFTPASKSSTVSTALQAGYENELGAMAPLNFFDPLNLCGPDCDQATFDRLREAEIRHGRCAMLAVTGWLTTAAGIRLPGMESMPYGFKALTPDAISGLDMEVRGCIPLTLGTIFFLTAFMRDATGENEFPGDYRNGFIDFGWDEESDAWKMSKRSVELNNGRAAQMGILGIMIHEQLGNLNSIGLPQP